MDTRISIQRELLPFLDIHLPEFSDLSLPLKQSTIKILLGCNLYHSEIPGAVAISVEYLKLLSLDKRTFNKINNTFNLFRISDIAYSHHKGIAQGYFPNPIINQLLRSFYKQARISSTKPLKRLKGMYYHNDLEINVGALNELYDEIQSLPITDNDSHLNCTKLMLINHLLIEAKANDNKISCFYQKARSGRLYGIGINLQNINKDIRKAALQGFGYKDIDLENSQPSLLLNFYKGETLQYYVNNKSKIRQRLANLIDEDITTIKNILISLFFGASTQLTPKSSVVKKLGMEKATVLLTDSWVKDLIKDIRKAKKELLSSDTGVNILTKLPTKVLENMKLNHKVAHILQNLESQILILCVKNYNADLLLHDGFITKDAVDLKELSTLVKNELSLEVEFSRELFDKIEKKMITQEYLKELFYYNGEDLIWKVTKAKRIKVGTIAGNINKVSGYRVIVVDGKYYKAHRLIWLYHYGSFPDNSIDHIDQNPSNNRIENLRDVTNQENHKNQSKYKNNTSGITGVYWDKDAGKWRAQGRINGKLMHLGFFTDKFEAICARKSWENKNNFHTNHGS